MTSVFMRLHRVSQTVSQANDLVDDAGLQQELVEPSNGLGSSILPLYVSK